MKRFILLFTSALLLASCMLSEQHETSRKYEPGEDGSYPISIYVEDPDVICQTKSSFTQEELTRITDMNILVYHDGKLLSEHSRYFADLSKVMMTFPSTKDGFNVYMVGNVGEVEAPEDESEISKLQYVVGSYDEFRTKGFPVANTFLNYQRGSQVEFKVKKLVGQYNIRIDASATEATYTVKDLRMKNCALDVYPFSYDTPAAVFGEENSVNTGDMLTSDDIAKLNAGETVTLFFIENLQGVLMPENTDRKQKIPTNLDPMIAKRCTYIEITADVQTKAVKYTNAKYRFYLGQDETTDFNIRRNTLYNATLDFTQNMVSEEEWRIEAEKPNIEVLMDKEEAMVIKGAEDMIFIQTLDNNGNQIDLDFDVKILSTSGKINVEKIQTSYLEDPELGESIGLRFTSNVDLCGLYPYDTEPTYDTETVRISSKETYNGAPIYTKDIEVRIYNKLFPLLIKLEKAATDTYNIVLRGQNPLKLGIAVGYTSTVQGVSQNRSGLELYDYISNGKRTDRTVNINGREFTQINNISTPSDLSRINFNVRGVNQGTKGVVAYPKLLSSEQIYMGANSAATYGPDSDLRPYIFSDTVEDQSLLYIIYDEEGRTISETPHGRTNEITTPGEGVWITAYLYNYYTSKDYTGPTHYHYDHYFRTGKVKTTYAYVYDIYHPSYTYNLPTRERDCLGVNQSNHDIIAEQDKITAPFYFINGGLTCCYASVYDTGYLGNWNNKNEKFVALYKFYGCGRDLFIENKQNEDIHIMKYSVWAWTNFWGDYKSSQGDKYYTGKCYMTINGCSSWPGADQTQFGYFTDEY